MKTLPLFDPHSNRCVIFTAACLLAVASSVRAQDVDICVRSKVMDKDFQWGHKTEWPEEGGHGKTFAILAVDEIKAADRLVKPVDKENILRQLVEQLLATGFKIYAKGSKPDILLSVSYGRGELQNPYLHGLGELALAPPPPPGSTPMSTSDGGATVVFLNGANEIGQSAIDKRTPGYEAGLQKAAQEKLFIRVTAFEYPKDSKTRPKMLWKTIVVADDPDHRDLNAIAAEMLKAAAPYFDKDIKKPEIEFWHGMPKGQVHVGTPEVVQTDLKK